MTPAEWNKANPEAHRSHNRKWAIGAGREKAKRYSRDAQMRKRASRYHLTREDVEALEIRRKEGPCDICGGLNAGNRYGSFNFDHDHQSMKFRGILCHDCNLLLGHAKDSVEVLEKAISYLRRHRNG